MCSLCLVNKKIARKYYKDEAFLIAVGSRIRAVRESKQISTEQLAVDCEVDYSQINRMELGKVNFSISYLFRIAKALDVDPSELLK